MQEEEFKNILRKKAEAFEVPLRSNAWNAVLDKRKNAQKPRRKYIIPIGFASVILVLCIAWYLGSKDIHEMIAANEPVMYVPAVSKPFIVKRTEPKIQKIKIKSARAEPKPDARIHSAQNSLPISKNKKLVHTEKIINIRADDNPVIEPTIQEVSVYVKDTPQEQINTLESIAKKQTIDIVVEAAEPENNDTSAVKFAQPEVVAASKADSVNYSGNLTESKPELSFGLALYGNYLPDHNILNAANTQEIKDLYPNAFDEHAKLVFLTGILGQINYKKITFSTGIAYSEIHFNKIYSAPVIDSVKSSVINQESLGQNTIDQQFNFIEIPLLAAFKMGNKKINFSIQSGIALQWMIKTQTYVFTKNQNEITYVSRNEISANRYTKFQYVFVGSLHINYTPFKHLSIFAGPTIRANQMPLYIKDYANRPVPVSGGVETGIKFYF